VSDSDKKKNVELIEMMAMSRGFLEKKFERPRLESVGQSRKTK
jgi:hypothetical protein